MSSFQRLGNITQAVKTNVPKISVPKVHIPTIDLQNVPVPDAAPLPPVHFYLSCVSLLFDIILLIISALDYGILSMWVTPPACVITLLYHISVLILSRRPREEENPSYYSTVVACAYIITIMWFIAFITTMVVLTGNNVTADYLHTHFGLPASKETQQLQCVLVVFELLLMGGIAVQGHLAARKDGEPPAWRPIPPDRLRGGSIIPIQMRVPTDF